MSQPSFAGHRTVNIRFLKLCHNSSEVAREQQPRAREILDGDVIYLVSRTLLPTIMGTHRDVRRQRHSDANIQLRNYVGKHSIPIDLDNVPA